MSGGTGLMIQEHATLNTAMAGTASGNWRLSPDPAPAGWACMPDIALRATGPGSEPVHVARAFTVDTLHRWGLTDRCEDIVIVVSEMLTNALRHGRPRRADTGRGGARRRAPIRLGLYNPGPWVLCAVADPAGPFRSPVRTALWTRPAAGCRSSPRSAMAGEYHSGRDGQGGLVNVARR